jgi:hypothetical protein
MHAIFSALEPSGASSARFSIKSSGKTPVQLAARSHALLVPSRSLSVVIRSRR